MIYAVAALGAAMMLWPKSVRKDMGIFTTTAPAKPVPLGPAGASFDEAIRALALVRARLERADTLDDDELAAVDVLTLALVRGSSK